MQDSYVVNLKAFDSNISRKVYTAIELIGLTLVVAAGLYIFLIKNLSLHQQYKYFAEIGGPGIILILAGGITASINSRKNYNYSLITFIKDNSFKVTDGLTNKDAPPSLIELGSTVKFKESLVGSVSGKRITISNISCGYLHKVADSYVLGGSLLIANLSRDCPRVDVAKRGDNFLEYAVSSSIGNEGMVPLNLEGDFNKNFLIRVAKGKELEAEEIFAPDFMAQLEDLNDCADFTISGNKLYIMYGSTSYNRKALNSIFATASLVIPHLEKSR